MNRAKASNYTTVNTSSLIEYIRDYNGELQQYISKAELQNIDRTTLKQTAADLETILKRIKRAKGVY